MKTKTSTLKLLKLFFFLISPIVLSSCQKNLTQSTAFTGTKNSLYTHQHDSATLHASQKTGTFLYFDTLTFNLAKRTPLLTTQDFYFNQKIKSKVNSFYKATSYKTKWLEDNAPGTLYYAVSDLLKNASMNGLGADDYEISRIEEKVKDIYKKNPINIQEIIEADIHLTEVYFLFTTHIAEGKVRSVGFGRSIWLREFKTPVDADIALLIQTTKPDDIALAINTLQPKNEQYIKLQTALAYYRSLNDIFTGKIPTLAAKEKIRPTERHTIIPFVRKKLSLTNSKVYISTAVDSLTGQVDSLNYDENLVSAVKNFQSKHGLEADGVIGEKTLRFLNQSFKEKADLIALNMERLRWIPENYCDNCIRVNVPEFKLRAFEKDRQTFEMKVIVGSPDKATPIFNDVLQHIVFSPTWTVPNSIIKEEIIPRLKKNPSYYAQKNYAFFKNELMIDPVNETWDEKANIYQYRVVQQPGPDNSLGLVKFLLKNDMSVYLHDTPNHSLFSKSYRALSHGCVRLDEPGRFAAYLLKDNKGWNSELVNKAMHSNVTATVQLKNRYNVYIEYFTVFVDDQGEINFREDIYGHDRHQLLQLFPLEKSSSAVAGI